MPKKGKVSIVRSEASFAVGAAERSLAKIKNLGTCQKNGTVVVVFLERARPLSCCHCV